MPSPRRTKLAYHTEHMIWNAVINHGTVNYAVKTKGECTTIIQRLHHYRQLDRVESRDGIQSPLDIYLIQRTGPTSLRISKRELTGVLTTATGETIDLGELQQQLDMENELELQQQGITFRDDPSPFDPDRPLGLTDD
jgi:hypothetical protein